MSVKCASSNASCSPSNPSNKISLYADDVILMVTNQPPSMTEIQSTLKWFSRVSYYKVNETRLFILDPCIDWLQLGIYCNLSYHTPGQKTVSHLGIQLTKSVKNCFASSYITFAKKMQSDLQKLAKHELSWSGILASFKMNHLPQLLYLFRTIPIPIPQSYFNSLNNNSK